MTFHEPVRVASQAPHTIAPLPLTLTQAWVRVSATQRLRGATRFLKWASKDVGFEVPEARGLKPDMLLLVAWQEHYARALGVGTPTLMAVSHITELARAEVVRFKRGGHPLRLSRCDNCGRHLGRGRKMVKVCARGRTYYICCEVSASSPNYMMMAWTGPLSS